MRHLRLFENFNDIESICKKYGIQNYTINEDGSIDVNGDVDLSNKGLTKIPLKFRNVSGRFNCFHNLLSDLEYSPLSVGGSFDCDYNKLTSLEGGPKEVGGYYYCNSNQLITLEGCPSSISGSFHCTYNYLTSFKGAPKSINGNFYFNENKIITMEGFPEYIKGIFTFKDNPIYSIYSIFNSYQRFKDSLDYGYIRGTDIIKSRFQEALDELGIEMPNKINGYNYI